MSKTEIDIDYAIIYVPKTGPNAGKRHTSWLTWAAAGDPPEDFGKIISIERIDHKKLNKIKFMKPTKDALLWAKRKSK